VGLVSSIYRMAPVAGGRSKRETERAVEGTLRRLVTVHGEAEVMRRLRTADVPREYETTRALLIVRAMYTEAR
jgi:hypothetical protein